MRTGIPASQHVNAEPNEFLNIITCVKLCFFSIRAAVNTPLLFCSSQASVKPQGEKTCRTAELPKNVIFAESNRFRMARRAGVHKIASPIGEGSQTRMLSFASDIFLNSNESSKGMISAQPVIAARASYKKSAPSTAKVWRTLWK
jgi:hypothetical protein